MFDVGRSVFFVDPIYETLSFFYDQTGRSRPKAALNTDSKRYHPYNPSIRAVGSTSRKPEWTKAGRYEAGYVL
jgi:hypothetical protein